MDKDKKDIKQYEKPTKEKFTEDQEYARQLEILNAKISFIANTRDQLLEALQKIIDKELSGDHKLSKSDIKEAENILGLQILQLMQDRSEAGESIWDIEAFRARSKEYVAFLLAPIDDWLRYLRYRTVFKKDNERYKRFMSKLAWQDLSIYIANSFYKKYKYLPYQIITREDLHQEAHLALLIAKKDYRPDRGSIKAFYFTAVYNHFFKLYEKANSEKRKSENRKYQIKYIPAHTEKFIDPDYGNFRTLNPSKHDKDSYVSQRFKGREHFELYDENEYQEPDRVEHRNGTGHDIYVIGSQIYIDAIRKPSPKGYRVIEKFFYPLGYRDVQGVRRGQSEPFNEYEYMSNICYYRRKKVFYRTPYFKSLIPGSALRDYSDEEKARLRVTPKRKKETRPLLATGYLYRETKIKENEFVGGIEWDEQREGFVKCYLPADAFRGRDLIYYKGQNPGKIDIDSPKITILPYKQKYEICELMKRADRILGGGIPICEYIEGEKITEHNIPAAKGGYISYTEQPPGFKDLKMEAWKFIQSFPDEQRQFFNLFYDDENIIITRKTIKKRFSKTIEDDFWVIENPLAGKYVNVPGEEKIYFQVSTLKDAARNLKMRNSKMKPLNDDGKNKLRQYFIERYGINIIRDISDKKVENKTYHFRTNFQVRELLKK